MTFWQSPTFSVLFAVIYLTVMVGWVWFVIKRLDPWLRRKVGERFGVTIIRSFRGHWQVKESGKGLGGCLIEMPQIVFWMPAVMLPLIILGLGLLLSQGT